MSEEHPFDKFVEAHHERNDVQAEESYEHGRVVYALKALKFPRAEILRFVRNERQFTGQDLLTFTGFNAAYPTFPLLLGASRLNGAKLHLDPNCLIPRLFTAFRETPFVKAFEEFYERNVSRSGVRGLGLVFPRNGIRQGFLIYHGFEVDVEHGLSWVYTGGPHKRRDRIFVQPFQQVLEAIHKQGRGWTHEN